MCVCVWGGVSVCLSRLQDGTKYFGIGVAGNSKPPDIGVMSYLPKNVLSHKINFY